MDIGYCCRNTGGIILMGGGSAYFYRLHSVIFAAQK